VNSNWNAPNERQDLVPLTGMPVHMKLEGEVVCGTAFKLWGGGLRFERGGKYITDKVLGWWPDGDADKRDAESIDLVRQWHEAFGVPVLDTPQIPAGRVELRLRLLREELKEVESAIAADDVPAVLHELMDMQYVLDGMILEFGLAAHKAKAFAEVHRANMSKLDVNGKPILREDGKVLKGPLFRKANVAALLADAD